MQPRRGVYNVGCRPTLACNHEEECTILGVGRPTLACNHEEECLMLGVGLRWHAITKRSV